MKPSNMFGEVKVSEGIVMTSINFNYVCLSRFVNFINHKSIKGSIFDYNLVTEIDSDECVYATFALNPNGKRIAIKFSFSAFREYLVKHGYRKPSLSDIDLEIKVYINRLIENKAVYK